MSQTVVFPDAVPPHTPSKPATAGKNDTKIQNQTSGKSRERGKPIACRSRRVEARTYDEGPPGPVRLRGREPRRGVAVGGAGGGGGGRERGGGGEAARVEAEPAEVGAHRGAHHVLHRLSGSGDRHRRRAELAGDRFGAASPRLGGFDTGRRVGLWVGLRGGRDGMAVAWKRFL